MLRRVNAAWFVIVILGGAKYSAGDQSMDRPMVLALKNGANLELKCDIPIDLRKHPACIVTLLRGEQSHIVLRHDLFPDERRRMVTALKDATIVEDAPSGRLLLILRRPLFEGWC